MKIIAFGHEKFVGKDTASNFLVSHIRTTKRNVLVRKTGFASKMKSIAHDLYGWSGLEDEEYYEIHQELKDVVLLAIGKSPRQVWIELGTTVGRHIYTETWIHYVLNLKCDYLTIKDLRFPNEGDAIHAKGGLCYKIENPRIAPTSDVADDAMRGWSKWDGTIINDCDLLTFNRRVISTIDGVLQ